MHPAKDYHRKSEIKDITSSAVYSEEEFDNQYVVDVPIVGKSGLCLIAEIPAHFDEILKQISVNSHGLPPNLSLNRQGLKSVLCQQAIDFKS